MAYNHRGEIVAKKFRNSGLTLNKLKGFLKVSTQTLYNYFAKEDLDYSTIYDIGKVIKYDFSKDFPEMAGFYVANEPETKYGPVDIDYKERYIRLLEEYNLLLQKRLDKTENTIDKIFDSLTKIETNQNNLRQSS